MLSTLLAVLALAIACCSGSLARSMMPGAARGTAAPARSGQTTTPRLAASYASLGSRILDEAETRAGDWYAYGAAGPSTFDCSGLVMWSAAQIGVSLPHSTYALLASPHLARTYSPQRGSLAFFGTGHVEIVTAWPHTTFGAHHSGTRVGWRPWNSYYAPTAYYNIR